MDFATLHRPERLDPDLLGCPLEQRKVNPVSRPLVSVIIPCYKQSHLIARAVRSCLVDNPLPTEIVVVDDGSPENISEAVGEFGATVKLIRTNNRGPSAARNTGIDAATGRFVKFLDVDDWLLPGSLFRQVNILQQDPGKILVTGYRLCYEDAGRPHEDYYPDFGLWQTTLVHRNPSAIHAYLLSRDLVSRIGCFDENLRVSEDYEYWLRAALLGVEAIVLQSIECVYYQHKNNTILDGERVRKWYHIVWKRHAEMVPTGSSSFKMKKEFLKACSTLIRHYPADPALPGIAENLLSALALERHDLSMKEVLELAEASADIMFICPDRNKTTVGYEILEWVVEHFDSHILTEYENHFLQSHYLSIGQALLKGGYKKLARRFFRGIQKIGKNYGVNYSLLARLQSSLSAVMPGPVSVAAYTGLHGVVEAYWKYLNRTLYKAVCVSRTDES